MDVKQQRNEGAPLALAMQWSARITTISLELVAPVLLGYWLDRRWDTLPLCVIIGAILGFFTATMSLMRLARPRDADRPPN